MKQDINYYKFINSETGHTIYFSSFPKDEPHATEQLEALRQKLACEQKLFIGNIYYLLYTEKDFED